MATRLDKERMREAMSARAAVLTRRELEAAGRAAEALVAQLPEWKQARTVCLYASFGQEPVTDGLLRLALDQGKTLLLPRMAPDRSASVRKVAALESLQVSRFGIREPADDAPVAAARDADLFLVPGLAFDRRGRRLGRGAGFYDRLLRGLPRKAFLLGHAHGFQLTGAVPSEEHDVRMRAVVTPQGTIRCRLR
ncbi:MAG: 5-formyltetrahydrofolate cyclo-ligase [Opitutales bacterium]